MCNFVCDKISRKCSVYPPELCSCQKTLKQHFRPVFPNLGVGNPTRGRKFKSEESQDNYQDRDQEIKHTNYVYFFQTFFNSSFFSRELLNNLTNQASRNTIGHKHKNYGKH